MKIYNKKQSGFTLVELVVVVAVVGVLAVVATPKIVGVANDARDAALKVVATALTNASTQNYAKRGADNTAGVSIQKCGDVTNTLQGRLPDGYEFPAANISAVSASAGVLANAQGYATDTATVAEVETECTVSTTTTPKRHMAFTAIGIL
jgi:prepilin-type N-terminal cleavage/methylation domain-containing protein